eukprot:7059935-Ditylum_brightwellii.AAC.1
MISALLCPPATDVVVISTHHDAVVLGIVEKHVNYEVLCDVMLLFTQGAGAKPNYIFLFTASTSGR